jgi:hypothetical protein
MYATEKTTKNEKKYICEKCNFFTCKKTDYNRHILTAKHKIATDSNSLATKNEKIHKVFVCENCNKEYYDRTGLWRHQKKCNFINENKTFVEESKNVCENNNYEAITHMLIDMMKSNQELQKQMIEAVCKTNNDMNSIINNNMQITNNNHTNQTNCNNKTFNLQFFLNETCKDAMNLSEFIENIKLQLSDLENIGKLGYVEGISNIIIKSLNALDVEKRPVHCSDIKREIMYVKDEDEWQKEQDDKTRIKSVISSVVSKNLGLLPEFQKKYPDYLKPDSKKSDEYNQIIMETMGGVPGNGEKNKEKIIRNIAKKVVIDKVG